MRYKLLLIAGLLAVLVLAAGMVRADVPRNMNIQGRLTDDTGAPVAPGFKIFTFKVFAAEVGGAEVWPAGPGEDQTIYTDDDGLWTAEVGKNLGLTEAVFTPDTNRWLEITVNDGVNPPETLPRIKLNTDPYSFRAANSQLALQATHATNADNLDGHPPSDFAEAKHLHDPADISPQGTGSGLDADLLDNRHAAYFLDAGNITSGVLGDARFSAYMDLTAEGYLDNSAANDILTRVQADNRFVELTGDVMTGYLGTPGVSCGHATLTGLFNLYQNGSANPVIVGGDYLGTGGKWNLYDEKGNAIVVAEGDLDGTGAYFSVLGKESGTSWFTVDGNYNAGNPMVSIYGSASATYFRTDLSDDNSVQLPPDAVAADEILDEPGIVSNRVSGFTGLTPGASMVDVVTVSITTPATGFIVVQGDAVVQTYGTTLRNQAMLQIDETAGGTLTAPYYRTAGLGGHSSATQYDYFPVTAVRVYSKAAGTYTFRLEAMPRADNGAGATTSIQYAWITATYYPTSYGSVATLVSAAEAGEFERAEPVSNAAIDPDGSALEGTLYRVDLRELELKGGGG